MTDLISSGTRTAWEVIESTCATQTDDGQVEHSDGAEGAIQLATEKALLDIADEMVQTFETTMYLHHPSGIDRWFSSQRPRQAPEVRTCSSVADDVGPLLRIEPTPAPTHLPAADAAPVPEDVVAAVRRAITAIEETTRRAAPRRTA